MKLALITDSHWGARGDSREFLNHMIKFYREVFWPEIDRRGITEIAHLGDIVDRRKFINFVTLNALRKEFIEQAETRNIKLHILVGNHDIPYRNTNEINAITETFSNNRNVSVYEEPTEIEIDGTQILMMPWINSTNHERCFDIIEKTTSQIMFGHLEIKGFEMYRGMPSQDGYESNVFDKFDIVASGHFHKKSTRGNIHYLGAPYEMTWSDYNCPRGFHIFDTDTREFEYIVNHLHIFHKIWYNDKDVNIKEFLEKDFSYLENTYVKVIVQHKSNAHYFDLWMNKLYEANPIDVTVVEDARNIDTLSDDDLLNEAEDTRSILSRYVNGLETTVDKKALDKLIISLYDEAVQLEVVEGL